MANDLQTNLDIIDDFTQRLQVAVIGAEETTAKHEHWVEGTSSEVIQTINGPIKTLRGLIADWDALFQASFDSTIESYDSQFAEKLVEYDNDFLNYLLNIGFEPAEIYQGGITLERRSQTVAYDGVTYYWAGALPFTTTGVFANEADWLIAPIVGGIEIPQITFATGGNLVRKTQSVLGTDGEWYFWTGSFPKTIPVASTLESAGGVGLNKFKLASGHVPVRPMMKILSTAAGYVLNAGSFEYGATITSSSQVLPELNTGRIWKWDGPIPKVVDLNSSPASSGGVGENLWNEVVTATGSSGSGITIGATKPTGVGSGHRWYCTTDGRTYVYYADGDSVQWVEESPQGSVLDGLTPRVREALRRSYAETGLNLVNGSFEAGGVLVNQTDVILSESNGVAYRGPAGVVAPGTSPSSGGFTEMGSYLLRQTAIKFVTPEMFTSFSANQTAAIQLAVDNGLFIDMSGRDWTITAPITLRDGTTLSLGSSNIVADTGGLPLFVYNSTSGKGITIEQGSGIITGTASAFLSCTGLSATPVNSDYVKQIRLRGVHVSSATIDKALHFVNAVRQIFIDSCMFYTRNGIVGSGKIVELKATKSIIYGSTNDIGTAGVQSISPGGGSSYSEGWHFTDCTIDNFEKTFDIRDIYVLTVNGGYVGCNSATGYAFSFGGRTTTHCREININTVIGGKIIFVSEPSGWIANSKISGIVTRVSSGVAVQFVNNVSGVDVTGLKFESITGAGCAVVGNNCSNISFGDITTDSSPSYGVQFVGANGAGCSIDGFVYRGSGQALFSQRPVIRKNIVSSVAADVAYSQQTDMVAPGSFAVGATIASLSMSIAKGERGFITFCLAFSGGDGSSQNIQLSLPSGVVVPTEPGQSPINTLLLSATGLASRTIPFYASSDVVTGAFSLTNQAGNTISVSSHSSFSINLI